MVSMQIGSEKDVFASSPPERCRFFEKKFQHPWSSLHNDGFCWNLEQSEADVPDIKTSRLRHMLIRVPHIYACNCFRFR